MSDELLTVGEAARKLRLSTGTVYRHVSRGALRAVRLGTTEKAPIRIPEDEIQRFTRATTIGDDLASRAQRLVASRGEDPADPVAYAEALRELGYEAQMFAERTARELSAQVETAALAGYVPPAAPGSDAITYASALRELGFHAEAAAVASGSDVVDVEKIITEELARLGTPLPVEIAQLGPKGVGLAALRILKDKGVDAYDERAYRAAVRQAIKDAINPKRTV